MTQKIQVEEYIHLLKWPVLLALSFQMIAVFLDYTRTLFWITIVALYLYIVFIGIKNIKTSIGTMAWLGAIIAFILALVIDLLELFFNFKFWYIFNLITEPLIYAVLGAAVMSLIFIIKNKIKKGGETNGK